MTALRLQQAVEEQALRVAVADRALRRAELAVGHARTPTAADHAHRQADTALIAVEDAESELARLRQLLTSAARAEQRTTGHATVRQGFADPATPFDAS